MRNVTKCLAASALAVAIIGCGENTPNEVSADKSLISMDLDMQNFQNAAREVTNKMLTTPRVQQELARIRQSKHGNPSVQIEEIVNQTGLKVNMNEFLISPIEEVFTNNGAFDFVSDSAMASQTAAGNDLLNGTQPNLPDVIMHGTVSKLSTYAGDTSQNIYQFDVRLTDAKTNTLLFSANQRTLPKQVKKSGIGF